MLEIIIQKGEFFDEKTQEFIMMNKDTKLQLEHSLISLKKWESKWHKPYLKDEDKTIEEIIDYVRCMTINHIEDQSVYNCLSSDNIKQITDYIRNPMTATWFSKDKSTGTPKFSEAVITNEIIYYWMISLNIPVEFQKWHLNQLLTLIKVVNIKNSPKKKMSREEEATQRKALNAARRAKYNSKG